MVKISSDSLRANGWKFVEELSRTVYRKTFELEDFIFYCTISRFSNSPFREWSVHVDNARFETVASLDVSSLDQVDALLNLLIYE